ncbi:hypothetical protein [Streptomyces sp. NBC_01233]|uniref:hypothetical protein n=1 Tax=Streptomyces sp. NBC_01233 TaxID=2903787 RepID=UPI002E0D4B8D|nr:hypothetical protein OG332_33755 [Streptomyces sp. NBC_01233]
MTVPRCKFRDKVAKGHSGRRLCPPARERADVDAADDGLRVPGFACRVGPDYREGGVRHGKNGRVRKAASWMGRFFEQFERWLSGKTPLEIKVGKKD